MSELEELAQFFVNIAQDKTRDVSWCSSAAQPFQGFEWEITSLSFLENLSHDNIAKAGERLSLNNLKEFTYASEGTSAVCLRNNDQAVRVGPLPDKRSKMLPQSREEHIRDYCPLVVQPSYKMHFREAAVGIEQLPFLKMLEDHEIPGLFRRLLKGVFEETCFMACRSGSDLGVFTDGTPVYVDPGATWLRDPDVKPTEYDFARIRQNCLGMELPEPLSWILPDGRFKQELFHPMKQTSDFDVVI